MQYTFHFHGGPLDGNAFHFDTEKPESSAEFGGQAYLDTRGGEIGRQFTVPNIDTPPDENGTVWEFRKHLYEVTDREEIDGGRLLVHAKHICAIFGEGIIPLPVEEYTDPKSGDRYSIEAFQLGNRKWGVAIFTRTRYVVLTEPHATAEHGPIVEFDSLDSALAAGVDYVKQNRLRG